MILQKLKGYPFAFLLAIPLLVLLVLYAFGFDGLYGQDSYEYFRYTERLVDFLKGGEYPGDLVWPKGYLFLSAFLSFILPTSVAGQVLSLACFYLSFYYLYETHKLLYKQINHLLEYLAIAFLLSPYLLRISSVMMSDTLAILCLTAAAYYVLSYSRERKFTSLLGLVFWASFGVFSRYAVVVPLAPLLLWAAVIWLKEHRWTHLLLLLIPAFFLLIHLYFEGNGSDFLSHYFIQQWDVANLFKREFVAATDQQLSTASYFLPNLLYYFLGFFHPGFFFLLPVLLIFLFKNKLLKQFPLAFWGSLIIYSIFLAGITFQGSRYLSLSFPFVLLLYYPAFIVLLQKIAKWKNPILISVILLQLLLFYKAMQPSFQMNQLEQYLAIELKEYQNQSLYSFEVDVSLEQRGLEFNYFNLWSQQFVEFEKGGLVLFNEARFAKKYEGKNIMLNWEKLQNEYGLTEEKNLKQGWKLYRINE